jgi:AraC family transcriptional regulator
VRTDLLRTSPGRIELAEHGDHRVQIHVGTPARGHCQHVFTTGPGDMHIFPAGMSDAWDELDPSTSILVHVPPALLLRTAEDLELDPKRAGLDARSHFRDPQIEHVAWALEAERAAGHPNGRLYTDSLGTALAIHLLRGYAAPVVRARGLSTPQLRRVTAYIEDHLHRDLSLARLARIAGVSASHFKTLFKRSTGLSVHAWVVQRRVERARALLVRGELPIGQVALEVGFSHGSHLARCMRRLIGVTPSALRRNST